MPNCWNYPKVSDAEGEQPRELATQKLSNARPAEEDEEPAEREEELAEREEEPVEREEEPAEREAEPATPNLSNTDPAQETPQKELQRLPESAGRGSSAASGGSAASGSARSSAPKKWPAKAHAAAMARKVPRRFYC